MNRFKQRLRKLESTFVVKTAPSQPWDDEFEIISHQDPEAFALLKESMAIIHDAVEHQPDREALQADPDRLYAAMDVRSLERLRDCINALHARVDLLRKRPRRPAESVVTRGTRRNGNGRAGTGDGA